MVNELFKLFGENSIVCIIFFVILLWMAIYEKNQKTKELLIYPSIVIIMMISNSIILEYAVKYMAMARVVRVYWLFPITIVLAYACVRVLEQFDNRPFYRNVICVILVVVIIKAGNYIFTEENFSRSENIYKLPNETVIICEAIAADGYVGVLVPSIDLVDTIRQYDSNIELAYGRDSMGRYENIGATMNGTTIDIEAIQKYVVQEKYRYVILDKTKEIQGEFNEIQFQLLLETDTHWLFKYVEK